MSLFVIVSRNHVLNNEKIFKIVDFVDDSGCFTPFCVTSRQKALENANFKKVELEIILKRANVDL